MNELVKVENGKVMVSPEFTSDYARFESLRLDMELKSKQVKEELKKAMEEHNVLTYEDDFMKFAYRKGTTRTSVDSKRLKEELPDIYEEYSKTSNVASSISMEVKC